MFSENFYVKRRGADFNLPILPDLAKYSDEPSLFDEFENLPILSKKYQEITNYLKSRIDSLDRSDSLDTIPVVTE
jgi:hypothetical protein